MEEGQLQPGHHLGSQRRPEHAAEHSQRRPSGLRTNSRDQREQQPASALPAVAGYRRQPRRGGPEVQTDQVRQRRSAAGSIGP
jgi:hypothetical protein